MTVLAKDNTAIEMRKVYCETMIEMAADDKRVMAVDADLVNPIGMMPFKKAYPDRLIDCGIMEGNMAGVAAGLSMAGFIPFTHTFSCFQSRKTIDQTFLTAGFAQANLVILPREYAEDFKTYTRLNPAPCPVLEIMDGDPRTCAMAAVSKRCSSERAVRMFSAETVSMVSSRS